MFIGNLNFLFGGAAALSFPSLKLAFSYGWVGAPFLVVISVVWTVLNACIANIFCSLMAFLSLPPLKIIRSSLFECIWITKPFPSLSLPGIGFVYGTRTEFPFKAEVLLTLTAHSLKLEQCDCHVTVTLLSWPCARMTHGTDRKISKCHCERGFLKPIFSIFLLFTDIKLAPNKRQIDFHGFCIETTTYYLLIPLRGKNIVVSQASSRECSRGLLYNSRVHTCTHYTNYKFMDCFWKATWETVIVAYL